MSKPLRVLHGAPHHAGVHHGRAVVGNGHDARLLHGADGSQLFARAAFGDGADGEDIHYCIAFGAVDDVAGYGGDCRSPATVFGMQQMEVNPPAAAARDSALDGFGVFEAGLAQVDVHVDEAGRDDQPGGVELFGAGGVELFADGGDVAVVA